MKKLRILFILLSISVFILSACGKENVENSKSESMQPSVSKNDLVVSDEYTISNPYIGDGYFIVKRNSDNKIAFMNLQGEILNESFYKGSVGFSDGLAFVFDEGSNFYIDVNGVKAIEKVNEKNIDFGDVFINGKAVVSLEGDIKDLNNPNYKKTIIDKKGDVIQGLPTKYNDYEILLNSGKGRYVFYEGAEKFGIFDLQENKPSTDLIYTFTLGFVDDRAVVVNENSEALLVNGAGDILKNFTKEYGEIDMDIQNYFSKGGIALNFKKGNSVLVDFDGNQIKKSKHSSLGKIEDGFINFQQDDKFGLIDLSDSEILKPQYDRVSNVYNGYILLNIGDKWFIHKL